MAINVNYKDIELDNFQNFNVENKVECKIENINLENSKILSINSKSVLNGFIKTNNDCFYGGKAYFNIVYMEDYKVKNYEAGVEFEYKCLQNIDKDLKILGAVSIKDEKIETINGITIITATICLSGRTYKANLLKLVDRVENVCSKSEDVSLTNFVDCFNSNYNIEDSFDLTMAVSKVLYHQEKVYVLNLECSQNSVSFDGEVEINFVFKGLEENSIKVEQKVIPFRCQLDNQNVFENSICYVKSCVVDTKIKAIADENKNKTSVELDLTLNANVEVYQKSSNKFILDMYKNDKELDIDTETTKISCLKELKFYTEKCFGELPYKNNKNTRLIFATSDKIESESYNIIDNKLNMSGVVEVCAYFIDEENNFIKEELLCPYNVDTIISNNNCCNFNLKVTNVNVRVIGDVIAYDFTLKCCYLELQDKNYKIVKNVVEGKDKQINSSAISVFIPQKDDTLWDICKTLGVSEEQVLKLNPNLSFPLCGTERIIIYREF